MTDDRSLERAARSWLDEGPTRAPDRPVDEALARIQTIRQERDLRVPWRTQPMMSRLAMAAAVALVVVVGAVAFGPLVSNLGPGASQSPSVPPTTAAPTAAGSGALGAYRTARNQICMTAVQAFTDNNDLVGLYDASTPPDRRTIVNANAQAIADAIAVMARDLAELQPPAELLEAHIADVARAEDQAAIFAAQVQLLGDGRFSDAAAQEVAMEAASNLRKPFETEHNLFNCP
jgi:hypothetical protein